jgi:excisionase family DNA binding protein
MTINPNPHHRPHAHDESRRDRPWRPAPPAPWRRRKGEHEDPAGLLGDGRLVLTVAEAGALLGISRALAYELVARGELPSLRLGRRLVVPKRALLELLGLGPVAEGA